MQTAGDRSSLLFAPHSENGRFFNPWNRLPHSLFDFLRVWSRPRPRSMRGSGRPTPCVAHGGRLQDSSSRDTGLTWIGHATFLIREAGEAILTDPHWGTRSLARRRRASPGLPLESLPPEVMAVVSHSHYDHLDAGTVDRLPPATRWFVPLGLGDWLRRRGHRQVVELDWWQSARHGAWTLTCLPAQHWSGRFDLRRNSTLWCSWLLDSGQRRYFFAGDGGYFPGFVEFGRRFAPVDVALLPIATYEPRWFMSYQHMGPAEAYQAFVDLEARWMVPMHWGTFQLGWDPTEDAPEVLERTVRGRGGDWQRVRTLATGETWAPPG